MAEDIDFKFPMKQSCTAEIGRFCADVPHGHARVVRCLQERLYDEAMGAECRAEVEQDIVRSNTDYRCLPIGFRALGMYGRLAGSIVAE